MERLQGKCAIVTGAGRGIGAEIARQFAAEGAAVLLMDLNAESVQEITASIQEAGGIVAAFTGDVTVDEDVRATVEKAVQHFGGLDIVVNNAALTWFGRRLDDSGAESRYDRLMATNVKSVWVTARYALPHLRARGAGSIINIASIHGLASESSNSAYAASKGALIAGTHAMAVELGPDLIRVNCISPGRIWTEPPGEWVRLHLGPELFEEFRERFGEWSEQARTQQQPLAVAGSPEDIAYCATYLASDEARFCTGANFVIDGGSTALLANPLSSHPAIAESRAHEQEIRAWINDARRRAAPS